MSFIKIKGLKGKVYVPEPDTGGMRKHHCKDCFSCQMCGDDRCNVCRGKDCRDKAKTGRPSPDKKNEGDS